MFKRFLTGAVLALTVAGLGTAAEAAAGGLHVANFDDKTAFQCQPGTQHDGGLAFAQTFMACYYSGADSADFPIIPESPVMAIGYSDIDMSMNNGSVFDLVALDLAAGVYTVPGDTTLVTGFLHGGGTVSQTLTLDTPFTTFSLNWSGLDSVRFSAPQANDGYVAFDNIVFRGNGVPEPAAWALMLAGLLGSGYMLRRARQLAAVEA